MNTFNCRACGLVFQVDMIIGINTCPLCAGQSLELDDQTTVSCENCGASVRYLSRQQCQDCESTLCSACVGLIERSLLLYGAADCAGCLERQLFP
jgi:hypothetical protein